MGVSLRQKKDNGVYYTPESTPLISFLCQQSILSYIYDTLSNETQSNYEIPSFLSINSIDMMPDSHLEHIYKNIQDIRILDPSVGSGAFLIDALNILDQIYIKLVKRGICDIPLSQIKSLILSQNLFGVDISETAVKRSIERLSQSVKDRSDIDQIELLRIQLRKHIRIGNALIGTIWGESSHPGDRKEWFDWKIEFPQVFMDGGFNVTIGNPPWNILKPLEKEFFSAFDNRLTKYGVDKITARKIIKKLLSNRTIEQEWIQYKSNIQRLAEFFRGEEYKHQSGLLNVVGNTKKISGDFNLYKLFLERYYELTRPGGYCGVIIPSGFHTDAGTKGLRELIFDRGQVKELHCFENRQGIFPTIHRSFKFDTLVFKKEGTTKTFRASFMQHNPEILTHHRNPSVVLDWQRIKDYSPSSWSIMEFKTPLDLEITERMYKHPPLGQDISGFWTFRLKRELDVTLDSHLFNKNEKGMIVYEGKMIEQYTHLFKDPRFWITDEALTSKYSPDYKDHRNIRLGFRAIAASTNRRTMIATVLPQSAVCGNSLILTKIFADSDVPQRLLLPEDVLYLTGVFNSFTFDFLLRLKISQNLNMFFIYDMPVPRVPRDNQLYKKIVQSVTSLMRNPPEKFALASISDRVEHLALIDCYIAQLYELSFSQFNYILNQFNLRDKKKEQLQTRHKNLARQLFQDFLTS
jgi:Alw26I/Eco31I/Esp3I family type II restriction m6 adenine DNA methyltransferase